MCLLIHGYFENVVVDYLRAAVHTATNSKGVTLSLGEVSRLDFNTDMIVDQSLSKTH